MYKYSIKGFHLTPQQLLCGGTTCSWSPVNTVGVCLCVCVLCKPHYLYHLIKFLSLSLSEIIEHLEKHQSATQTQKLTNAHTAGTQQTHARAHTHTLISKIHKKANTILCLVLIYDPRLNRDKSGTLSQKMCDCILELPPRHSSCLMKNIFLFWPLSSPVHPLLTLSPRLLSPSTPFAQNRN